MIDHSTVDNPQCRVLIVDDNHDAADTLAMLLSMQGYKIRTVYDGRSALLAMREFVPTVALFDLGMPDMSGYELAEAVRAEAVNPELKLIALSGYGREDDRRRTAQAGFDWHLTKPVDLDRVETLLREIAESPLQRA